VERSLAGDRGSCLCSSKHNYRNAASQVLNWPFTEVTAAKEGSSIEFVDNLDKKLG